MQESLLTIEDIESVIQKVTLDIDALCLTEKQREQFENKFLKFLDSDHTHSRIFSRRNNAIIYLTENIIPRKKDDRPPLMLLFGNPASHSVASGMFFSFEGNEREHRFWKIIRQSDILSFSDSVKGESVEELNKLREKELCELSYTSPFRIGLAVFYTMPSPASSRDWAGVSGLRKLFGKEALTRICECEENRIARMIREFVSPNGAVMTFQKDAYLAIKSSTCSDYTLDKAKAGSLIGNCRCDSDIRLLCLPPTRILHGYLDLLRDFRDRILKAR